MKNIIIALCLINNVLMAQNRNIVINECMPNNSNTASDQDGEFNDWVELYNTSNSAINLEGYFLSDRRSQPTKFKFPNIIVQPEDYLIIWVDTDSTQTGLHTNFKLSASSEQVYLFNTDTNLIDYVHFYNMQADQSIARTHDGNGPFKILSPTFDSSNGNHSSGLVINEWMPFNESVEEDEYGEYNDWIELYNNSNQSINLEGYFLSNKANEATKYQFPNISIGSHEYLVLWADEDTLQGDLHLPFKLDSERDDIVLARPDTSTIDYFFHHHVDSNLTQARIPNGTGNIEVGMSTIGSVNEAFISIRDTNTPEFSIYPNPCNDFFTIEKVNNEVQYFELIDSKGAVFKTIYSKDLHTQVKLTNLESGLYILKSLQVNQNILIY
tara:strand:- start:792 stop:1940 length:1149 start_codon:yes stop_codon:yes gene_type:complete